VNGIGVHTAVTTAAACPDGSRIEPAQPYGESRASA
jgi:hypothetical protein